MRLNSRVIRQLYKVSTTAAQRTNLAVGLLPSAQQIRKRAYGAKFQQHSSAFSLGNLNAAGLWRYLQIMKR